MTTCRGCGGPVPPSTLPVDVCSYECKIATDGPGVPDDLGQIAARLTATANDDRKSPAPTAASGASQPSVPAAAAEQAWRTVPFSAPEQVDEPLDYCAVCTVASSQSAEEQP